MKTMGLREDNEVSTAFLVFSDVLRIFSHKHSRLLAMGADVLGALVRAVLLVVLPVTCIFSSCRAKPDVVQGVHQKKDHMLEDPPLPGVKTAEVPNPRYRAALLAKGATYKPRTEHLLANGSPEFVNRLIFESSPYLLQHAHNPVNWYPWGDDAFERARREHKLIIMSIGYSTCHWCHVMERESFEDLEIAAYMNQHFIAVKVDREERPDVDSAYMMAVNMLTGRGGWPMTTVLTPDREVVFAGTYFPPRDGVRGARVGFLSIIQKLNAAYASNASSMVEKAKNLSLRMEAAAKPQRPGNVPRAQVLVRAENTLARSFDSVHGGFSGAPKFPRPVTLDFLSRYARRAASAEAKNMVERTLQMMGQGGIHDQVGGGFHRYSTDEKWLVPHFEKMLYDNAQLVIAYLEGYQLTGRVYFEEVAERTLDYVLREMTHAQGGFFSATDADSPVPGKEGAQHNEEGLFFTWTPKEVDAVLGSGSLAARVVLTHLNITAAGDFEGRSIPHLTQQVSKTAAALHMNTVDVEAALSKALPLLYAERQKRPPPLRDDKIILSWNALMISALAKAGEVLGNQKYTQGAARAAEFLLVRLRRGHRLERSWLDGGERVSSPAFLDDYAFFIYALLDLFETTQEKRWFTAAIELQKIQDQLFWDAEDGGYFFTAVDAEKLSVREKPDYDGAEPGGNSFALLNLLRLEQFTGEYSYREIAERGFMAFADTMERSGRAVPKMLCALDYYFDEPLQVIIVLPQRTEGAARLEKDRLSQVVAQTFVPNRVFIRGTAAELQELQGVIPLVKDKVARGNKATAYVCKRQICALPTTDADVLARQLAEFKPLISTPSPSPRR